MRASSSLPESRVSAGEVFLAFLKLGLLSFGGPVAHLAYFRNEFVARRRWLDDEEYSDLVALCQFLPGPASSQVGLALGMRQAGGWGALAAWAGFTLPSAIALILFAYSVAQYPAVSGSAVVHGLKIAAVAVVAHAVLGMARSLCPDLLRKGLAVLATVTTLAIPSLAGQLLAIGVSGLLGYKFLAAPRSNPQAGRGVNISRGIAYAALFLFILILIGLPMWAAASGSNTIALLDGVYRAGALVFGGGHVVLPWLQDAVEATGTVSRADFLAGYGAAQAVPGPLFTFAAYLGTVAAWPLNGWLGGVLLLVVLFAPGFLLLIAALPFWERLRKRETLRGVLAGINAAVVGILAAALYDPVWLGAVHEWVDAALALIAFGLLLRTRLSPVLVVLLVALTAWALSF